MAKILIIGTGVIGSVYGARLIKAGNEVAFLARGSRLESLHKEGLVVKWMNGTKERFSTFRCFNELPPGEVFDYVLITVRNDNLSSVYPLLTKDLSPNVVFMVNNPEGSKEYLQHVSSERLIIGFPGAGGEIVGGVVYGHIVSGFIQPTTIGKIGVNNQSGLMELKRILNVAGFPVSINSNMDSWLVNHLAMVCPLGNAIYAAGGDNYTASKNHEVIKNTALALKEAFLFLKRNGFGINPATNYMFIYCPVFILTFMLRLVYNTRWAATVIANHSLNARTEMRLLSDGFIQIAVKKQKRIPYFEELASYNSKG